MPFNSSHLHFSQAVNTKFTSYPTGACTFEGGSEGRNEKLLRMGTIKRACSSCVFELDELRRVVTAGHMPCYLPLASC